MFSFPYNFLIKPVKTETGCNRNEALLESLKMYLFNNIFMGPSIT